MQKKINLILLVNLGSPDKLTTKDIRNFLRKFLSDKRVVNLPKILWYPILYFIILSFRPKKLIHKYRQIWLNDASPLAYYTKCQANKLRQAIGDDNTIIEYAFMYSNPDIVSVLKQIEKNVVIATLKIISLYPQYSSTTIAPVFDVIASYYANKKYIPSLKVLNSFYNHEKYISAIAATIMESRKHYTSDKLIFSYHSIPQNLITAGDTYYAECMETTYLIANKINLKPSEYMVSFQSKFGSQKWLTPATTVVIKQLALAGVKNIDVVCPGFVADCLETLEEINIMNREIFINNGGES
ncbi:MAG: ferrochelatase, partial [Burkholderiales bacterium]|nr:ferrochelatase [Burkholderiales bacterium]